MADFIECFMQNPNGKETLDEVVKLYAQADKNVHAAAELPSVRLQKFNELYRDAGNQKILGKSNDDAAAKFRKIVDSILALFQKDTKQKLSGIWASPVDSLKTAASKVAGYSPFNNKNK